MFNGAGGELELHESAAGLLAELHAGAAVMPATEYRSWALRQFQPHFGFMGAAWGAGSTVTGRVHSLHVEGDAAPAAHRAEVGGLLQAWLCPATPTNCCLQSIHLDTESGLTRFIVLSRPPHRDGFTERQRTLLERLASQLTVAWRTCQVIDLYARAAAVRGRVAAIVDREGYVHVADGRFYSTLRSAWPQWAGHSIPLGLIELLTHGQSGIVRNVDWTVEALGDRYFLSGTPLGALARLTPRERSIARAIVEGLSYPHCAEQFGISINTLRNTVVRTYRKTGVASRLELARRLDFAR